MKRKNRQGESGMTMVELLIAMTVLAIGLGGVMIVISGAIASNSRNKLDTTATALAQAVMEHIASKGPDASSSFTITDCGGTAVTIDPRGAASPGLGAPIVNGEIAFTGFTAKTPKIGYDIVFASCGLKNEQQAYHVRWNVTTLQTSGSGKVYSKMITVSARQVGGDSFSNFRNLFAPPATLRTIVTN